MEGVRQMSGGNYYEEYSDFTATTPIAIATPSDHLINMAQKKSTVIGRFLPGKGKSRVLQGGTKIQETVIARDPGNLTEYLHGETFTLDNPQITENVEQHWRSFFVPRSWNEKEILGQIPQGMNKENRKAAYKKMDKVKDAGVATATVNSLDTIMFRTPFGNYAEMEGSRGKKVTGLPVFINEEDAEGTAGVNEPGDGCYPGWTNIMGKDPTVDRWHRCERKQYDFTNPQDTDGDQDGLFNAVEAMVLSLYWQKPPIHEEHFQDLELGHGERFIATQTYGKQLWMSMIREGNDSFHGNKAHTDPIILDTIAAGIPVEHFIELDTADLYPGAGGTTRVAWDDPTVDDTGPRFMFIDPNLITMIYHSIKAFAKGKVMEPHNQVGSRYQLCDTWGNLFCHMRQGNGIIYPGGS